MRTSTFSSRTLARLLALSLSMVIAACGGSKDPILGMGQLLALAPSVSATAPLASNPVVTGVAVNTRITATFNKPMSATSLNTDTFNLQCPEGVNTVGSVDYDAPSRVATWTPAANLPAGTRCTATVTTGAQDTNGVALPANYTWAFVTGSSSDITRPTVTQQVPAQGAIAATNTQLIATFSEEMTPSSLNAVSFTLQTTADSTPVLGTVSYAVGARTATFTPTVSSTTLGSVQVASGAFHDLAGNPSQVSESLYLSVDTEIPTVAITSSTSTLNAGDTAIVTFTLSESSDSFGADSITVVSNAASCRVRKLRTFCSASC